jgi:hypothetical protein
MTLKIIKFAVSCILYMSAIAGIVYLMNFLTL